MRRRKARSSIGSRTLPFQGSKTGSTPVRVTDEQNVAKLSIALGGQLNSAIPDTTKRDVG